MSLIDLDISSSYETNNEVNVLEDFYIPVLSSSVSYDRLSGYYRLPALVYVQKE